MAIASKCPACPSTRFDLNTESPAGSNFQYAFIRCAACGTVVGVLEASNLEAEVQKLRALVEKMVRAAGLGPRP